MNNSPPIFDARKREVWTLIKTSAYSLKEVHYSLKNDFGLFFILLKLFCYSFKLRIILCFKTSLFSIHFFCYSFSNHNKIRRLIMYSIIIKPNPDPHQRQTRPSLRCSMMPRISAEITRLVHWPIPGPL